MHHRLVRHRSAAIFHVVLLIGLACWRPAKAQDLTDLARDARYAVVLLKVFDRFGRELGTGSGFFVDPEGLIVTNHHVVEPGYRIEAVLSNERSLEVVGVLGSDEVNDLAVVKVEPGPFPALSLAESASVEAGERVVVLGSPLGLVGTLSEGIVSAIRDDEEVIGEDRKPVLQITAAISPGSSGSPVMNLRGEVVGVAVSQFLSGQNLNFAVSSDAVRDLLGLIDAGMTPQRLSGGTVEVGTGAYVRNLVISLLFFAAIYLGFRYLK